MRSLLTIPVLVVALLGVTADSASAQRYGRHGGGQSVVRVQRGHHSTYSHPRYTHHRYGHARYGHSTYRHHTYRHPVYTHHYRYRPTYRYGRYCYR